MALRSILSIFFLLYILTPSYGSYGQVLTVIDGDTYDICLDGSLVRIRLLLVDTPELHHPLKGQEELGIEAKKAAQELLSSSIVRVDLRGKDRYGRSLGHVWIKDGCSEKLLSACLCRMGLAVPLIMDCDDHVKEVMDAFDEGRSIGEGLWRKASRRVFSNRQASHEYPYIVGHFITLNMTIKKILESDKMIRLYPEDGSIVVSIRKSGWNGPSFSKYQSIKIVGKVSSGYRGPEMNLVSAAQLGISR